MQLGCVSKGRESCKRNDPDKAAHPDGWISEF